MTPDTWAATAADIDRRWERSPARWRRHLHALQTRQRAVFHRARDTFRDAAGLRNWGGPGQFKTHYFGHTSFWEPRHETPGPMLRHVDHCAAYAVKPRGQKLAALVSWPYASPKDVHDHLREATSSRFLWAVVDKTYPACRVYGATSCAWILADRDTCDAAAVVEHFVGGVWATEFAARQAEIAALEQEVLRRIEIASCTA